MREIIVDNFAGGGGASLGIFMATGCHPDIAINHDAEAIEMHKANHPDTVHYPENIWDVDPVKAVAGRSVGLAWFSPDCTYHSKARGKKPFRDRNKARRRRGLAWTVVRWARAVKPRVIVLENVEEFQDWGPLADDGMPCPIRKGLTFRRWKKQLENTGYIVDCRELRADHYDTPTSRNRLFVIARCDGLPIVWPKQSHGDPNSPAVKKGLLNPWRTAAECIDWNIPTPSIFLTKEEGKAIGVKRPLVENTMKRIARGTWRYILTNTNPFIVPVTHSGDARYHSINDPLRTITTAKRGEHALIVPFLAKHYGGNYVGPGIDMTSPTSTITATDHHALVSSFLVKLRGTCKDGQIINKPMPTITAGGQHLGEVRAFLVKYYGTEQDPRLNEPLHTITTKARFGIVTVSGEDYMLMDIGMRMLQPRELYRAQGFPDSYIIDATSPVTGRPLTKEAQVRMVGNSVCPPLAKALVDANYSELSESIDKYARG